MLMMSSSEFGGVFVDDDYDDGLYALSLSSERSCLVQVKLKVKVQQRELGWRKLNLANSYSELL